jgi:hypothetical protein
MDGHRRGEKEAALSFPLRAGKLAVATAAAMLCLAGPVAGKVKPPPCPGGFFLVDGEPLAGCGCQ